VNFGTPVPLLIGIVLILGAVALFFLDKFKPGYGRDSDKVYAILWLISGVFLLGHLTMELLASFQQLIMAGMLIAITIENVLSRTPREDKYAAQGAAEAGPRDYYRPSRTPNYRPSPRMNVRAELDNDDLYRNRFPEDRYAAEDRRMLSGRQEPATRRPGSYGDDYPDRYNDSRSAYGERPAPGAERPAGRLNPSGDRIRRRRPKSGDGWYGAEAAASWDESASGYAQDTGGYSANAGGYSANAGGYSAHAGSYSNQGASSPSAYPQNNTDADSYVDYRPVDYPNDESKKPSSDYGSRY
jgi:hypothetical protein